MGLKLLTTIAGGDHNLVNTSFNHGVLDIVNHRTAKNLNHRFGTSSGERHQTRALATRHDDAQHRRPSASTNGAHAAHVLLL